MVKPVLSTNESYGLADPDKYLLGRGKLYADFYDSSNQPTGLFTDLGNATAFALNIDEETLEHKSSRSGLAIVDAVVTLSKSLQGSFTLDEVGADQIAAFTSGTIAEQATPTVTFTSGSRLDLVVPANAGGRTLEIFDAADNDRRHRNITGFGAFTAGTGGTALVAGPGPGADYIVDLTAGTVHIIAGGALDAGSSASVHLDFVSPEGDDQAVLMLQDTTVRAAVLFIGENAQTGQKFELRLHKCKVVSEGDAPFLGDDFSAMGFSFTAETTTDARFSTSPVGTLVVNSPD